MLEVRQTLEFSRWIDGLKDPRAVARIDVRIRRLAMGNMGDVKGLGGGVSELRVHHGPGYRVYFTRRGEGVVLLLCGGVKRGQSADVARARRLAGEIENDS